MNHMRLLLITTRFAHSLALPTHVEKNALGFRQVEGLSTAANGEAFFDVVTEEPIETGLARVAHQELSDLVTMWRTTLLFYLPSLSKREGDANTPSFPTKILLSLGLNASLNSPIWADQTKRKNGGGGGREEKKRGNPGLAGIGSTFERSNGDFLLTYCAQRGSDYEVLGSVWQSLKPLNRQPLRDGPTFGLKQTLKQIRAFGSSTATMGLNARWKHVQNILQKFVITSIWREANFSGDLLCRKGVTLTHNMGRTYLGRPSWITRWEHPASTYYRFR
ncbi:hypothetical protein IFM89_034602 [Coptis chinensis]|uniref:Uncharacterized protein n=1 Tax=Coptis chinensis TaxID=261450 RepID=A0A835HPT2_9MAGN|nr:hypothetical protein IFM89_034602 [Coptis chinensis]